MSEPRDLWAKAPANLITDPYLAPPAVLVYLWLDLRAGQRGYWYGPQREIAEAVHQSARVVSRAIAGLRDRGYITTSRAGNRDGVNTYEIAARLRHQRPIPDGSVTPISTTGSATSGATDETHLFNHRPNHRSNKRGMLKPQTDWDQVMQAHGRKAVAG